MTIKRLILLSIICFVIMPILLLPFFTTKIYEGILVEKINESTEQKLEQIANNLENAVTSMVAASNILCSDHEIVSILGKNKSGDSIEEFYDYKTITDKISKAFNITLILYQADIILWGVNGKIYSTEGAYNTFDYQEITRQDWYAQSIRMDGYALWLSSVGLHTGLNISGAKNNIVMTRVVKDDNNSGFFGVLAISLYPDNNLKKILKVEDAAENNRIFLVNSENKVILAENNDYIGTDLAGEMDVSKLSGEENPFISEVSGEKTLVKYYDIKRTNWKVVQMIPYQNLMKEVTQLRLYNFVINLVLMSVLVLIAMVLSNRIATPLHQLSVLMTGLSKGNFRDKMHVKGESEIARLCQSFNVMVDDMGKLIQELQHSSEVREKLRLEALQAQINPHFLFNTLNSIKWMAAVQGAPKVSQMIAALGNLLDATLYRNEEMIPISEELKSIEDYVLLQKMRFGDKFQLTCKIPDQLLRYKIPALIFQPLIENCIIHGFAEMDAGGEITLSGDIQTDAVFIEIKDNGKGMEPERLEIILSTHNQQKGRFSNIGIRNVNDRIQLRFGPEYGITVRSEAGKGTTIRLKLPPFEGDG